MQPQQPRLATLQRRSDFRNYYLHGGQSGSRSFNGNRINRFVVGTVNSAQLSAVDNSLTAVVGYYKLFVRCCNSKKKEKEMQNRLLQLATNIYDVVV
jgi:hypothetical protein